MPMPIRIGAGRSPASSLFKAAMPATIARAAARAWREPTAGPVSIPNSAITPSPVNWLVTPPALVMAVPTAAL